MPSRYAPVLFGLVLSGLMSLIVSDVATLRNSGFGDGFSAMWINAWLLSWLVAFPVVLVVAPVTRRLVGMMVKAQEASVR